jgi:small subunit ribosomal protein S13
MVRLMGLNLPDSARVEYALTMLYGVGFTRAKKILEATKIEAHKRVRELKEEDIRRIQEFLEKNFKVEGELKSEIADNIKRLREIASYRGYRHARGLPVRGQRTRSNARTRKGKKKTIGALSKEAWAKIDTQAAASSSKAK